MKISRNIMTLGIILIPLLGFCQKTKKAPFDPFSLKAEDYSKANHNDIFDDGKGNTLKVLKTQYERCLLIKITKDGKEKWVKHGMFYDYHSNGSLNYEVPYRYGKREGLWRSFRFDKSRNEKSVSYEKTYKNDVPHGPYYSYYRDGSLEEKGNYKPGPAKSEKDGEWLQYRDGPGTSQGPIMWKRYYEYGSREGTWSFYDHKGKLESTATYKNGKLVTKSQ